MARRLRYTGENPPAEVLAEYPNWEYALGEEDVPGQDETTLMPAEVQSRITEDVAFSAADVWFPGGQTYPALLYLIGLDVSGLTVYEPPEDWLIDYDVRNELWIEPQWLFEAARIRGMSLNDPHRFPLRVATRLPYGHTGKPWRIEVAPDGSATEW